MEGKISILKQRQDYIEHLYLKNKISRVNFYKRNEEIQNEINELNDMIRKNTNRTINDLDDEDNK